MKPMEEVVTGIVTEQVTTTAVPQLAAPDAERAIAIVNRWLHTEGGTAVNVSQASFDQKTLAWHLPVQLAYPDTGPVGIIGDVYLHALSGQMGTPGRRIGTARAGIGAGTGAG